MPAFGVWLWMVVWVSWARLSQSVCGGGLWGPVLDTAGLPKATPRLLPNIALEPTVRNTTIWNGPRMGGLNRPGFEEASSAGEDEDWRNGEATVAS